MIKGIFFFCVCLLYIYFKVSLTTQIEHPDLLIHSFWLVNSWFFEVLEDTNYILPIDFSAIMGYELGWEKKEKKTPQICF